MLGVDGVVFDRGVEPEAVAVGLAVVEGCLKLFAAAASATPAAAAPAAGAVLATFGIRVALTGVGVLILVLLDDLLDRGRFDLGFDLVAQVDFARA